MKVKELKRVAPNKVGRIITNCVKLKTHEESTAIFLTQFGFNIEFIVPRNDYRSKSADFFINGAIWEAKSPIGNGKNNLARQFHYASKQAGKLILDLRRIKMPTVKSEHQAKACFENTRNIRRLILITKDGRLLDISG